MYKQNLSSIPERNECEDDEKALKWVPKKKHEVLKAKYKCLKKLFQIYDASVIGILPEAYEQAENLTADENRKHVKRKKRSHRTKTDACAGTTEVSSGDASARSEDKGSVASSVIRDLNIECSSSSQKMSEQGNSQINLERPANVEKVSEGHKHDMQYQQQRIQMIHPDISQYPYIVYNERKPTRFQCFLQRLFGLRREKLKYGYGPSGHIYAASDNNINYNYCGKRRRSGLRFRRLKKAKRTHSEMILRDLASPAILDYVQAIQKSCLTDRTPRQCPITGCKSLFYGIINYNDHLNLSHFVNRKYICHYCHEGFENEVDKYGHENEHLGVSKLAPNLQNISITSASKNIQISSNTQTEEPKSDIPEEKLKKIVSFFDKIADTEEILMELHKNRYSESNMQTNQQSKTESDSTSETITTNSDRRTVSFENMNKRIDNNSKTSKQSDLSSKYSPMKCHHCGEGFDYRQQLCYHMSVEHGRRPEKPCKFHSCVGIADCRRRRSDKVKFETGKINIQTLHVTGRRSSSSLAQDSCSVVKPNVFTIHKSTHTDASDCLRCRRFQVRFLVSRPKSKISLPSENLVYYDSRATKKKPSAIISFVERVRSGITTYRWEPGTKIIRV
ncbi:hypothetical protein NE865_12205 [Phthorimaea operculella]|nr:hypothetical protein NE865_12205 [Phthorimaea operculella]